MSRARMSSAIVEKQMGPDTIMIVLPSDHEIENVTGFQQCLLAAAHAAQDGYLVTIGIHASSPDTGFGYIQRGESLHTGSIPVYKVRRFREKPDSATAQEYVDSGEYDWNAGMFIASVRTFRALYRAHLPEMEPLLEEMIAVYGTPQQEVTFARAYPLLPKISFDFAIAEKADKVAVVPASIGWSDVGSWARLAELLHPHSDERDNILFGHRHQLVDTHRSLIYAPDKMVALIGLEDIVVVDTPDAILIASKERSEDVKKIVDALAEEGRHDLL
jgi:mannose-1-phosphate guanylyltransferase